MLPKTNARLLIITGGGTSEDFGSTEGADTEKWRGNQGAYITERVLVEVGGGGLDEAKQTVLIIDSGHTVAQGDTVTYTYDGAEHTRRVRDIERHKLVGTTRLHLWEA